MENFQMDDNLRTAFDAAAGHFLEQLQQQTPLTPDNWVEALKAGGIPEELNRVLPRCPEQRTAEDQFIHTVCVKLLLMATGMGIEMHQREWEVMYHRCGLTDGKIHTREETGVLFGVSKNRIRMVEEKFFRKIRHILVRHRNLREFLD